MLARVDVFADALAGAPLSADGPLLFTGRDVLDPDVATELRRVLEPGATVYLLGGDAALSDAVAAAVGELGYEAVRLAGPSRVETSLRVADAVRALTPGTTAALARADASGQHPTAAWADSVAGGAWGASAGVPILLTPSAGLHPAVANWLDGDGTATTVLLGGAAALAPEVEQAVPRPLRISGVDRPATAAGVATQLWASVPEAFVLVNGYHERGWAEGLAAAGLAGDLAAPVLLIHTDFVPDATIAAAQSHCDAAAGAIAIGGASAISDDLLAEVRQACSR